MGGRDALQFNFHDAGIADVRLGPRRELHLTIDLDPVWKALADPTRRAILDALKDGPQNTGGLTDCFPGLSRFGVMKHLEVLREAGLVTTTSKGRERINHLNAIPIQRIHDRWVTGFARYWAPKLVDIKADAEAAAKVGSPPDSGNRG